MAKKFGCLFIFLNILQMLRFTSCENDDLQQKFTTKCEDLCENTVEMKTEVNFVNNCQKSITAPTVLVVHVYNSMLFYF